MIREAGVMAIVCGLLLAGAASSNANGCKLFQLQINPIAPGRTDIFIGRTEQLEVQFTNDKTEGTVEVFPEPPMTVISRKFKTKCSINGGVWVRNSVYVSENSEIIVTQEYSGSKDSLTFYNVQTCQKINEVDISNSTWKIQGTEITVSKQDSLDEKVDTVLKKYSLNASCHAVRRVGPR